MSGLVVVLTCVIGTASRAEHVINSETEDIAKRVKEITGMPDCLHASLHHAAVNAFRSTAHVSSLNCCETVATM